MTCGIAGFVGLRDKSLLKKMLDVQKHRGPDSTGLFVDNEVCLGTDRLSIIDLSTGDQPIHNEDGSIWITFNGEIYNYVELRAELESLGHSFYTLTDTETIVHAYEQWGEDCLARLRGMFAFAVWDSRKDLLFCARDRFGKKPFFYAVVGDVFFFSSELKGILQYEEVNREINRRALDLFFTYNYIPSPFTIFSGIYKLQPGHCLTFSQNKASVKSYWDVEFNPLIYDEGNATDTIFSLLSDAVRLRMRSDVPVGVFLSGGIDSGIVASLMSKYGKVRSVTVGFEENDSHIRYGRTVADFIHSEHSEYIAGRGSLNELPELIWYFDEPFADSSLIPTYHVSKTMRNSAGIKVALTGDGGDEMFLGYDFFKEVNHYGIYKAIPDSLREGILKAIIRIPVRNEVRKLALYSLEKKYHEQDFFGRYVMRLTLFTPEMLAKLYNDTSSPTNTLEYIYSFIKKYSSFDEMTAINYATFKTYLSEMILTKVDRMSMAVSLEPRCPMLDNVFAEYVTKIPWQMKLRKGETKYILKKMALEKSLLPKEVIYRKKVGFGAPVHEWITKEWKEVLPSIIEKASKLGIFNKEYLSKLQEDPYLHSSKLFSISTFTLWNEIYIERRENKPVSLNKII